MGGRGDVMLHELEALYRARFPRFLRVARAVVGDRERALDAVQDGFADAIRSRRTFRGDGSLEAWVWRAVLNAARKAAARGPLELELVPSSGTSSAAAPESAITPLLARLAPRQRLVVFFRYYADLDYRSIAAALDIEVGTVSATLAAARANIRKALVEVADD